MKENSGVRTTCRNLIKSLLQINMASGLKTFIFIFSFFLEIKVTGVVKKLRFPGNSIKGLTLFNIIQVKPDPQLKFQLARQLRQN